ncbi:isopenicillin N synthase family dioxygenase [Modestobacter versicolor]|uniref:Isopenicillin N synthase family oxygenase n=1 Tax=Modestobacter versicolor TaxID=429133 RepID=A0A323VQN6_9ACTN|nr:2-oxoglutarate and iron-dependent oxygenase domain-containing protein [Modestobacter versicolor]MBB3676148.1 isopenicillin N synthase-like dioxygenase [Modestobacter versicolor]PZA21608.1 isopenicillin N synthase family oxygenase [Modestobacter versicolor]
MTAVPLVDLTPWYEGSPAGRRQVATDVDRALCEVGFLLVTGHPVGAALRDRLRAEVRPFFALPPTEKAELACFPGGRGWVPPGAAATASDGSTVPPDLRESFTFGPEQVPPAVLGTSEEEWFGPNSWPASTPGLPAAATAFSDCCARLADDLLRVCALALDLDDDYFAGRCAGGTWSVDLTWYPARSAVGPVLPGQLRRGPHTDVGTLTVLDREPGSGGLQVRTLDGEWVDAPYVPGALTVNAGDLLARWTGDRWRSTPHRVLPPPVEVPTEELLSLVFAQVADPLAVVGTLPTAAAGPTRYVPVTAGQFLRGRMDSITVG